MGLKTNSKQAIKNIRQYIIDGFDGDSYGWTDVNSFEDVSKCIMSAFYIERAKPLVEDRQYFRTYQEAFIDWCSGLPTIIDTCYYYNRSAIKDLGDILEETFVERMEYTESEAEEKLSYLIFREILKGCKHKYKDFMGCN